jgi:Prokaryotic homologs of the JAB domain
MSVVPMPPRADCPYGYRVAKLRSSTLVVLTEDVRRYFHDEVDCSGDETGGFLFGSSQPGEIVVEVAVATVRDSGPTWLDLDLESAEDWVDHFGRRGPGWEPVGCWHTHATGTGGASKTDFETWTAQARAVGTDCYAGVILSDNGKLNISAYVVEAPASGSWVISRPRSLVQEVAPIPLRAERSA